MAGKRINKPSDKILVVSAIILLLLTALVSQIMKKTSSTTPVKAKADLMGIHYYGTRVYQSYVAKNDTGTITLPASIYLPNDVIPTGAIMAIGATALGTGDVMATDSQNNIYTLVKKVNITGNANVYLFTSTITNPLKTGDIITVTDTSAKSLAYTTQAFSGVSAVGRVQTTSGYSNLPTSQTIAANQANVVLNIFGFNMRSDAVGVTAASNVTYMGAAGTEVNPSNVNSVAVMQSFITTTAGFYRINYPTFNNKSNSKPASSFSWSSIIVTLQ